MSNSTSKKVITFLYNLPKETEFNKRNKYLEVSEKLKIDVGIICDSDEFFIYPPQTQQEEESPDRSNCWTRFKKDIEIQMIQNSKHNVYGINYIDEAGTDTYKPRIWVKPYQMRYTNNSHYHYANVVYEKETIETFKQNRLNYDNKQQKSSNLVG